MYSASASEQYEPFVPDYRDNRATRAIEADIRWLSHGESTRLEFAAAKAAKAHDAAEDHSSILARAKLLAGVRIVRGYRVRGRELTTAADIWDHGETEMVIALLRGITSLTELEAGLFPLSEPRSAGRASRATPSADGDARPAILQSPQITPETPRP